MIVPSRTLAGALALALRDAGVAPAQQDDRGDERGRGAERSAGWTMMRSFDRKAPAVGEPLPDVLAYTAEGQPVSSR